MINGGLAQAFVQPLDLGLTPHPELLFGQRGPRGHLEGEGSHGGHSPVIDWSPGGQTEPNQ